MKLYKQISLVVGMVWVAMFGVIALAADYSMFGTPWKIITVTTSATKTVIIPDDEITFVHLNIQDDGTTASASTDRVMIMLKTAVTGTSQTIDTSLDDEDKCPLVAGGSATFPGLYVTNGPSGPREVQLKASGNGAKVLIIRGQYVNR